MVHKGPKQGAMALTEAPWPLRCSPYTCSRIRYCSSASLSEPSQTPHHGCVCASSKVKGLRHSRKPCCPFVLFAPLGGGSSVWDPYRSHITSLDRRHSKILKKNFHKIKRGEVGLSNDSKNLPLALKVVGTYFAELF